MLSHFLSCLYIWRECKIHTWIVATVLMNIVPRRVQKKKHHKVDPSLFGVINVHSFFLPSSQGKEFSYSEMDLRKPKRFATFSFGLKRKKRRDEDILSKSTFGLHSPSIGEHEEVTSFSQFMPDFVQCPLSSARTAIVVSHPQHYWPTARKMCYHDVFCYRYWVKTCFFFMEDWSCCALSKCHCSISCSLGCISRILTDSCWTIISMLQDS